jgi:hypothetical protein
MPPRQATAVALRAALTFSCAVLLHDVLHAAGDRSFVLDSPAHLGMAAVALAMLAYAGVLLGLFASSVERRRRLALVRAALPRAGPVDTALGLATQGILAIALFGTEQDVRFAPERLVLAIVCGLVGLAISAFVFTGSTRRIVAALAALFATRDRRRAAHASIRHAVLPVRIRADFRLFIPNRPPPLAA